MGYYLLPLAAAVRFGAAQALDQDMAEDNVAQELLISLAIQDVYNRASWPPCKKPFEIDLAVSSDIWEYLDDPANKAHYPWDLFGSVFEQENLPPMTCYATIN